MNILAQLKSRFEATLSLDTATARELLQQIRPAQNPRFGDYQANLAMALAGREGRNSREVAAGLVDRLQVDDLCHPPEIAGPGFINLRLRDDWIASQLEQALVDDRLGIGPARPSRTFVIDFSSPNVAKPMHVGHIRSTVIGDALSRILRFLGHRVITDNHLGDWGTQFGMILYGYKHFVDDDAYQRSPIEELTRLYRRVRKLIDYLDGQKALAGRRQTLERLQSELAALEEQISSADKSQRKKLGKERARLAEKAGELSDVIAASESTIAEVQRDPGLLADAERHAALAEAVLEETAKLHAGDQENRRLWSEFLPHCLEDLHRIYRKLGVIFDFEYGESFYQDLLESVVDEFQRQGLATLSEDAVCVFVDDFETPMIIRKKDGAFLYATSDLATIRYRAQTWDPDVLLYVVDHRQHEHFAKLFSVARRWGYDRMEYHHLAFGTVMGEDRKPIKTRAGETVGLEGLIDEAVARAAEVVRANAPEVSDRGPDEMQQQEVARIVGIGALKYADLSQSRSTDYVFSYDKMLETRGNSAPYLQYSYARNQGIFRRGEIDPADLRADGQPIRLDDPAERALGLALLRFEEALHDVTGDFRPHLLCTYLYELAQVYSAFFENCPVLKAEDPAVRRSRLKLCDLTQRTLRCGLGLLGIEVTDRM